MPAVVYWRSHQNVLPRCKLFICFEFSGFFRDLFAIDYHYSGTYTVFLCCKFLVDIEFSSQYIVAIANSVELRQISLPTGKTRTKKYMFIIIGN